MSVTVQTVITNKSRGTRSLLVARGKSYSMRAGETKVLDYDIWSFLTPTMKRKLERDVAQGLLSVTTRVYTDGSNFSVDPDGSYQISNGGLPEAKASVKEKVKLPNPKFADENKTKIVSKDGITIADRSSGAMQSKLGAKEVKEDTEAKTPETPKTGFTKIEQEASNVFQSNRTNVDTSSATSMFKNQDKENLKAAEAQQEAPEMTFDAYIDELFKAKDFNKIYAVLVAEYPKSNFSKSTIRKCSSYADLKEKYSVLA